MRSCKPQREVPFYSNAGLRALCQALADLRRAGRPHTPSSPSVASGYANPLCPHPFVYVLGSDSLNNLKLCNKQDNKLKEHCLSNLISNASYADEASHCATATPLSVAPQDALKE